MATVSLTVTVENVPDATFTIAYPGAPATVDENEVWTSLAPQLGGDDAPNGALTWSKSGVDAGDFEIDADGVLTLPGQDYENPADADQDREYQVTVKADDEDGNMATVSLTVTVENVPDAMFTIAYPGAPDTVDENEVWTSMAPQLGGDDAPNGALTWSKSGVDAGDFGIDADGVLTLPGQDYENPDDADQDREYQVTVKADDEDGNMATVSLTVTVENVPDATFTIAYPGAPATVEENEVWTSLAPQLGGADAPNGALTWSKSGVDAGDFGIDAASGVLTLQGQDYENPADADQDREYQVTVKADDEDGNMATVSLTVTVENVPDATFTIAYPGAPDTVDENEVWTSLAPQLGGADAPNGALTWSKSGVDAGEFEIDAASGVLTLQGQDYENPDDADQDREYQVTVKADDEDGNMATVSLTVTVENVPDATFTIAYPGAPDTVDENEVWTSLTPELGGADAPNGTLTWSKSGDDAGDFEIDAAGVLTLPGQDYENPADTGRNNSYKVTVTATDEDENMATVSLTVTVENVPDAMFTIAYPGAPDTVDENEVWTSLTPELGGADAPNGTLTWSKSGVDAGDFGIDAAGVLTLPGQDYENPADADQDREYQVTVKADDEDGNTATVSLTVTVENVPDAMFTIAYPGAAATVDENEVWTSLAPQLGGDDAPNGALTWSKSGVDAGDFGIDADGVLTMPGQDYENPADADQDREYQVTVKADDEDGNMATVSLTVTVENVPDATFTIAYPGAPDTVEENEVWTSLAPQLGGADAPNGALTWSKSGVDAGDFGIDAASGVLTLPGQDYENPADADQDREYQVTVKADDEDGNMATVSLTVTVENVPDAMFTIAYPGAPDTVDENEVWTSLTPELGGADAPNGALTWSKSGVDAGDFGIDAAGVLTLPGQDYENPADADQDREYQVTVKADDEDGNMATVSLTVTVENVPDAMFTIAYPGAPDTVDENEVWTSLAPQLGGADAPNGALTWSKSGVDAGDFEIDADGVLTLPGQDYENPADADQDREYQVTVKADDEDGNMATVSLTVTVENVPDATFTIAYPGAPDTVDENEVWTSMAPQLGGADAPNGALTWSKSGVDAGEFEIDAASGVLTLQGQDYENPDDADQDREYQVTVKADDEDGNMATVSLTVTVENVPDAMFTIAYPGAPDTVDENEVWTSLTPELGGADAPNGTLTWSKSGDDAGDFEIDAAGVLTLPGQDYENPDDTGRNNSYKVTVTATDEDENMATVSLTVTVENVPDAMFTIAYPGAPDTVDENEVWTSLTPELGGADAPNGTLTWSKSGVDAGDFGIDAAGVLTLPGQDYENPADADQDREYQVTVKADDEDGNMATVSLTVTVENVPDAMFTIAYPGAPDTVDENEVWTSLAPQLGGADAPNGALTWSKSGVDAGDFEIDADGVLTLPGQDYENPADADQDREYQVTVKADDEDGNMATVSLTVTVENVPDAMFTIAYPGAPDTVDENEVWTSLAPQLGGADAPNGALTWSKSGVDAGDFALVAASGVLMLPGQDYENPADADQDREYQVTVTATDEDENTATVSLTVTVENVPDAMFTIAYPGAAATVDENEVWTSLAPQLGGADAPNGALTWSKSGVDAGDFEIDADGVLTLPGQDYENPADADQDREYQVTVKADDEDGNMATVSLTVTVENVPDAMFTIAYPGAPDTVEENEVWTSMAPQLGGDDAPNGALTWSKSGVDAGDFALVAASGVLMLPGQDYENPDDADQDREYQVTVTATDEDENTATVSLTVTVENVPDAMFTIAYPGAAATVDENEVWTSLTPQLGGADAPNGALTWSKSGVDAGDFGIDAASGVLTLPGQDYENPDDADQDREYQVTVKADDEDGNMATVSLTVTVENVPDATFTIAYPGAPDTVDENEVWTSLAPQLGGADAPNGALTWSKSGVDAGDFEIDADGVLTLPGQDYENPDDADQDREYQVTVKADDEDGNMATVSLTVTVENVPDATFTIAYPGAPDTVEENEVWTSMAPQLGGADAPNGALTWSKSGVDAGEFEIDAASGVLTLQGQDYENPDDADQDREYQVTVKADDEDGNMATVSLTVTVENVPDAMFTIAYPGAPDTVDENEVWTSLTPQLGGDDAPNGTLTWSKSGDDAGDFEIDAAGVLTLPGQDYENPDDTGRNNSYKVTVTATDEDENMATVSLTVTVENVPDAMFTIAYPGAPDTVDENEVWTSLTPELGGADAPNGTLTWSKSGVDAGDFGIDAAGVLTLPGQDYENPADADQDREYQVTVKADDEDGNTATVSLTVTVENVPDAMFTIAYPGAAATVDENEVWTSLAPQLGGDDAPNGALTWSKSGVDAGDFGIDADGVLTMPGQDYENPDDADQDREYQVTVKADDEDGNMATVSLTVTVENVPDATFTIAYPGAPDTVDENEVWTSLAPQLGGDDAPNGALTWSKSGVDAGDFEIDADGVLTLPGQDYENPDDADQDREYQVTVKADDEDGNMATVSLTVTVENVPDATFTIAYPGAPDTVDENEVWTSLAPQLGGDDAPNGALTWSKSGVDAGDFGIDADGVLTLPGQDYENPADADQDREYQVTVKADDEDGNMATVSLTVTVENVPDATFTIAYPGAPDTVDENEVWTSLAPQLGGDDAPNGALTWSKSGVDAGDFEIDADGVLTLPGQDYENPADADQDREYQVTVKADDEDGNMATVSLTVTVENVPDAMFTIAYPGAPDTVDENEVWTSLAPQLGGDDAPNGALTWSKSGVDAGDFEIDADGVLTLPGQDYENPADADQDREYQVTVKADDEDGNMATVSLTVTVENVPDATFTIAYPGAPATVEENEVWTSLAPQLGGDDAPNGALTWSKSGVDAGDFEIDADGVLTMPGQDYENPADADQDREYQVTVKADDEDGNMATVSLTVTVENVPDATFTIAYPGAPDTVEENEVWTSLAPQLGGADAPNGALTWSKSGVDAGDFEIDADGVLTLPGQDYENPADADQDREYQVTVTATDGDENTATVSLTVTVENVPDAMFTIAYPGAAATVDENEVWTSMAPQLGGDDAPNGTLTWSKSGVDAGDFGIDDSGVLTLPGQDYENPDDADRDRDYEVTVTATDADGNTATVSLTVTVDNVEEDATFTIAYPGAPDTVDENEVWTSLAPQLGGDDAPNGTLTWSKSGVDAGDFEIDADGVLTLPGQDYENPDDADQDREYQVTVKADDEDGNTATVSLTVTVENVPDAMFTIAYPGAAATVDENEVWTSMAPQLGGDDAPNGTLTWSKSGVDAGDFGIDAAGVLTLPGQDYENPDDADQDRKYQVTVTATDEDENTATVSLTVTVENVPDAMFTIAYPGAAATVDENEVWTSLAPQLGGDDAPNGTLTWSKSGVDAGDFGIDAAGVLTLPGQDYENPDDADQDRKYQVTVTATDEDENTATVSLTVTVENVPDAMFTIAYPGAPDTVDENEVWTSLAPQLGGDDAPNGTLTWSKSGVDAGDFEIDAAGVLTLPGQDYENPDDADQDREYQVTVTATDGDENTATVSLTVTVENVPDAMFTIAYPGAAATVDENEVWTSLAPQLGGDDAPNGTLTWSKSGVDAGDFGIDAAGVLTLPGQDYENPDDADRDRDYEVTVTATDADGNTATVSLTVTVDNVEEDAMFTIAYPGAAATVDENEVWTSMAPQLGGDDAPNGTLTWSKSGVDAGDFGIDAAGVLTLPGQDYENPDDADRDRDYEVTVTATDADGNTATVSLTVTVDNVEEDATFTIAYPDAAATVDENEVWTSMAPQLGGDDAPNGTLTWSKSGVDAGDFEIDAAGVLTLPGQDYENPDDADRDRDYEVTVTATDADDNTATAAVTVTVTDVQEPATFSITGLNDDTVKEHEVWTSPEPGLIGAPIGGIGAVTWSITAGADRALFTIVVASGVLTLPGQDYENLRDVAEAGAAGADGDYDGAAGADGDYDGAAGADGDYDGAAGADGDYEVTVTATDADGNEATASVTVTVEDVIERVTFTITYPADATVNEHQVWTSPTPTLSGEPIGGADAVTWSITAGADRNLFTIVAASGVLTLPRQDYENPLDDGSNNVYEVTVKATDEDGNSASHELAVAVTVTVTDVVEDRTEMLLRGVVDFGRAVSLQVMDAVGQRLGRKFNPDDSSATLGGRRLNLSGGSSAQPDPFGALRNEADVAYELRSMSLREFLLSSAFHLSAPGTDQVGQWSAWARGAGASVSSGDARSSFSGDVSTAMLGADCECGPVLAGMTVAYSESSGEAEEDGGASARVNSLLTSAYPYLKISVNERLSVWGMLGYGKGRSGLTAAGEERVETDIEMKMGAFGARRELSPLGNYELEFESDVLWMRVNSEAMPGLVSAASADASRLRLRLKTSRRHELASGALLTPSLELGLRHDGSDAETGAGLELGGRLLYAGADRRLALDANVRVLIVHAHSEYKEQIFGGGSVRLKPNRWGHGLSLNLSSSWGDAASGVDDLWSHRPAGGADAGSSRRLDIEIGYGMNAPGGGVLTPYVGAALPSDGARVYRSGWRLALKPSLNLSLEASARETVGGTLEHGLMLRAELSAW